MTSKVEDKNTTVKLNVIAAADKSMGIGKNGVLPWHLPTEFQYFLTMTANPRPGPRGEKRHNAIIIGRKTWDTMDQVTNKPFANALNIVLSENLLTEDVSRYENTIVCNSIDEAVERLHKESHLDEVWVFGGAQVYRSAILSPYFNRLYLSRIHETYDCDSHFPPDIDPDSNCFKRLTKEQTNDGRVPTGMITDKTTGVKFEVCVYEKEQNC